jgi:hypothetical protein
MDDGLELANRCVRFSQHTLQSFDDGAAWIVRGREPLAGEDQIAVLVD